MINIRLVSVKANLSSEYLLQPPVGNALGVVSTPGGGGGERPNSSSMAGTGMDGPTLNMGGSRVRPRDRVGNDHVIFQNKHATLCQPVVVVFPISQLISSCGWKSFNKPCIDFCAVWNGRRPYPRDKTKNTR